MRPTRSIRLRFPVGGVAKRHGYEYQPQHTTPDALNVWSCQSSTGRYRGGVRPGLATLGSVGGAPYGWCRAQFYRSGSKTGVAVAHASGVSISTDGADWTNNPNGLYISRSTGGTNFSSCAIHDSVLFQAVGGLDCFYRDLSTDGAAAALGTGAPQRCGIVLAAMDRLWLAGDTQNPNILYASKVGPDGDDWGKPLGDPDEDPGKTDIWDYAGTDSGAAWVSGGVNGHISSNITALHDHGSNCVIIGHVDGISVVSGNPRGGGTRRVQNQIHGPLNNNCICKGEQDETWMFTRGGVYHIGPGCIGRGMEITSRSRERLPKSLYAVNPGAGDVAAIGYDFANRGLHIYVDRAGAGTDEYWFYDIMDGGFWPMSFPDAMHLAVPLPTIMGDDESGMLAITSGGSAKQFDADQTTDYSNAIDSRLYVGPIKLGNDDKDGILVDCFPVLAENSGNMAWSVQVGDSAQEAYANSAQFTGSTWDIQGLNHRQHPRARGHSAYLKLEDVSGSVWSFEEIVVNVQPGGRRRVY